ncbi:MAG: DUF177 domain-containing protein [Candidatus Promineifilaceae bacterium]|nr:DUF177 domain-containing protein [Candidatus Promineifilaceae bacterium]
MKSKKKSSRLRFNFGFLLEADLGTRRTIELDYPTIRVEDVRLAPLRGSFQAIRASKGIYITGTLNTSIATECARCLTGVMFSAELQLDDMFYYPASLAPPGEFGVGEDGFIDLTPLVRQLSLLEVPMQLYCQEACKGLCVECGQNLNEGQCDCVPEAIDPRMAALKNLLESSS